jgi:hypothetical protein
MPGSRNSKASPGFEPLVAGLLAAGLSFLAAAFFYSRGCLLYYGDAEAHLNIARRMVDSRTPGYDQIGTVWLPLPHLLLLPLVKDDRLWRTGLAGSISGGACFVLAAVFLFAAAREAFQDRAAAVAACCLFALNPNLLYLQSTAMTEPVFFAAFAALLYFTVRFLRTHSLVSVAGAGLATLAATLTRYEGWFLIPFVTAFFLIAGRGRRFVSAASFATLAALGPLYWLGHNWWLCGNVLEFYNGPYSAQGIYHRALAAGLARYPGDHELAKAWFYFRSAAELCVGPALFWLGIAGSLAALLKKAFWPLFLLALPPVFYVLSIYSSGTPIFVPHLWPFSYYNTRYGLAVLPLVAFAGAALVALAPPRIRTVAAALVVLAPIVGWLLDPRMDSFICWKESQVNSNARRAWTGQAADFLAAHRAPGDGVFASFGDLTGVFRQAGIPLRTTLHEGNNPQWLAATARPDLFLSEPWAVAISGDVVSSTIEKADLTGPHYRRAATIIVKGASPIEIYDREDTWRGFGGAGPRPAPSGGQAGDLPHHKQP